MHFTQVKQGKPVEQSSELIHQKNTSVNFWPEMK